MKGSTTLQERVDGALQANPHLFGRRVHLRAAEGRVVLQGTVGSFFQKQMAQEAVRVVDGVQEIDNRLEVVWPWAQV